VGQGPPSTTNWQELVNDFTNQLDTDATQLVSLSHTHVYFSLVVCLTQCTLTLRDFD
jgi:hypothetical protein